MTGGEEDGGGSNRSCGASQIFEKIAAGYSLIHEFKGFKGSNRLVYFVAFNIDGGEGTGGAEVLAGSAADTQGFVDSGDVSSELIVGIEGHHL